jgi:hypothetical protein
MEEVRKVGGVRRSLACGARLPNTLRVVFERLVTPRDLALVAVEMTLDLVCKQFVVQSRSYHILHPHTSSEEAQVA